MASRGRSVLVLLFRRLFKRRRIAPRLVVRSDVQEESRLTNTAKFEEEKQFRGPPAHHYVQPSEGQYAAALERGSVVNPFATRGTHGEPILPYHPTDQSRNQMYNPLQSTGFSGVHAVNQSALTYTRSSHGNLNKSDLRHPRPPSQAEYPPAPSGYGAPPKYLEPREEADNSRVI